MSNTTPPSDQPSNGPPPHLGSIRMPGSTSSASPFSIANITGSSSVASHPANTETRSPRSSTLDSSAPSEKPSLHPPVQKNLQAFGFTPKKPTPKAHSAPPAKNMPFMGSLDPSQQAFAADIASAIELGIRSATGGNHVIAPRKPVVTTPVVVKGSIGNPFDIGESSHLPYLPLFAVAVPLWLPSLSCDRRAIVASVFRALVAAVSAPLWLPFPCPCGFRFRALVASVSVPLWHPFLCACGLRCQARSLITVPSDIPKKVLHLVRGYDYVPLTYLQMKNRSDSTSTSTSISFDAISGSLVAAEAHASRAGELDIPHMEWRSCLELLASTVAEVHGDDIGSLWNSHVSNCINIGHALSFKIAMAYDADFRRAVASHRSLDISVYDYHRLDLVCSKLAHEEGLKSPSAAVISSNLLAVAFDAEQLGAVRPVALQRGPLPAVHAPSSQVMRDTLTSSSQHQARLFASTLRERPPAPVRNVLALTSAPSVELPSMAQVLAPEASDPRTVVSPIIPEVLVETLVSFDLLDDWTHIVDGVSNGTEFISSYIAGEQAAGRFSRAYTPNDLEALIGPFRTSPLGLVPKPGSNSFRLVQDMSYPRNSDVPSVNAQLNSDDFPTEWGTFADTAELILSLPEGCKAATFDISAAYRITPVFPAQQNSLCLYWDNMVYVDRAVCFGLSTSAGVFGSIADMLVAIYKKWGVRGLLKWVDDFFAIRFPDQSWTEEEFVALTGAFGIPWSIKKTRRFSHIQQYIGFLWDLARKVVSMPPAKLESVVEILKGWRIPGARFSESQALSLQGKLIHISCIYPLIRPFISSSGVFARSFRSSSAKLSVPNFVDADISWILWLLEILPNEMPLVSPGPIDLGWWGDASSSYGVAIVVGDYWAVWTWAPGFKVGPKCDNTPRPSRLQAKVVNISASFGQFGGCRLFEERKVKKSISERDTKEDICIVGSSFSPNFSRTRRFLGQHLRSSVSGRYSSLSGEISSHLQGLVYPTSPTSCGQTQASIFAYPVIRAQRIVPSITPGSDRVVEDISSLVLQPSPLRPDCAAGERMFKWKGISFPPNPVLDVPVLLYLHQLATSNSLGDPGSVGSALRKYHIFCDVFSVAEKDRIPASPPLLHSFALWAATDPNPSDPAFPCNIPWETVAVDTVLKYLSGIRAWHLAQGWCPPLSENDFATIRFSLRGLARIQGARRLKPPRPPITIPMMRALRLSLNLEDGFDACLWAACTCAFWGLMRWGEVSVRSRSSFSPNSSITRADAHLLVDSLGKEYIRLDLPKAKTAEPGRSQSVFLPTGGDLCPAAALINLERVVPASGRDPLFSWKDNSGSIRPLVRKSSLSRVNSVLASMGWGNAFGHSFRIGGASYLLAQGVSPEIVCIAGRWRSLAYELYIRSFQDIFSKHISCVTS
ncbi:hypothetical protein D9757_011918 [Collybiopsis confluens]|uniref:Reverse transcriptase domain-containing protein n=1 Tax=Collybiopsis confluens TaxID=2823264 RepID=A0A8H5GKW5_9AGAR|nr:hypothetical protein D9757_011918 [Collybiopsis confluens]